VAAALLEVKLLLYYICDSWGLMALLTQQQTMEDKMVAILCDTAMLPIHPLKGGFTDVGRHTASGSEPKATRWSV
jgi:hypothetical protein